MASTEGSDLLVPDFTGGSPPSASGDSPFEALDDLLHVVEALCPEWPQRPIDPSPWVFKI
jgi:hypothetical protein